MRQTVSAVLDSDAAQPVALPIQETSVMVGVTPINAKKIFIAPPECGGVEALSADAVLDTPAPNGREQGVIVFLLGLSWS